MQRWVLGAFDQTVCANMANKRGKETLLGGNNIFLTFLRTYVHNSRDGARSALLGEFNALVKQV